jgi:hypothetical protein
MKRVRFQVEDRLIDVVCTFPNRSDLSIDELRRTWYLPDEYDSFKESAKVLSSELRHSGWSHLLKGSIQPICSDKDFASDNEDEIQNRLMSWSRVGEFCRGLEGMVDSTHGKARRKMQRDAIQMVLRAQKMHRNSCSQLTRETLKQISEQYTASARAYAQKLGIADAAAAFFEHRKSKKHQTVIRGNVISENGDHHVRFE